MGHLITIHPNHTFRPDHNSIIYSIHIYIYIYFLYSTATHILSGETYKAYTPAAAHKLFTSMHLQSPVKSHQLASTTSKRPTWMNDDEDATASTPDKSAIALKSFSTSLIELGLRSTRFWVCADPDTGLPMLEPEEDDQKRNILFQLMLASINVSLHQPHTKRNYGRLSHSLHSSCPN